MKVNDPCVIRSGNGKSWSKGKVLEVSGNGIRVGIGEPHQVGYESGWCERRDVKRYEPLTEDKSADHEALIPTVLEAANQALADLLPTEVAELKDGIVSAYYGAVTLEPIVYDQETIGAVQERGGWSVTVWRKFPATRHSPEEMSDSAIGSFPNYAAAVRKFVETVFACKAEDYYQHKADEAMAEAWAAGEL